MIYFTSDTHFYHTNIVTLCKRLFRSYQDMQQNDVNNFTPLCIETMLKWDQSKQPNQSGGYAR